MTVLSSCDSYLSKVPSPSTSAPINNVEQLVAIYDNATAFINETNPFACYSNDDADLTAELYKGEFYQFNLSSCIRQQNSLTAQFVSFSLANLANIFYPPDFYNN